MKGILILKLNEARNLEAKDVTGASDPYFVISLGNQRAVSHVRWKTLNPSYEETFNFLLTGDDSTLMIEGWDRDTFMKDDFLGYIVLTLNDLKNYQPDTQWYHLKDAKKGEVRVTTTFISLAHGDARERDILGLTEDSAPANPPDQSPPAERKEIRDGADNKDNKGAEDIHAMTNEQLSRSGIPFVHRGEMWFTHSGAKKKLVPGEYARLVAQIKEKASPEVVEQIEKDLPRTFPDNPFYAPPDAPGLAVLRRVLLAYSLHNHKIDYCQGMNFVAAILLLFLEEEDAFWALDAVVEDLLPNYYDTQLGGLQVDSRLADYYVMQYFPEMRMHLDKLNASASINCMKWFLSIYVGIFSSETTLRIWDSLFCTGRDVLLQTYLAILRQKLGSIMKTTHAAEFYEIMQTIPPSVRAAHPLFNEIHKHFLHLFQVQKMRTNIQKAVSDAINKREEMRWRSQTHFSIKELEELKKSFAKFATNNTLSRADFDKLMQDKLGKDVLFADNIFSVFDKSGDGKIDFREFCTGLSVYAKGSIEERLTFCFSVFDMNMDGFVQPEELLQILQSQYKLLFHEEPDFVKKFVEYATVFDVNKDGKFSLEEFKEVVNRQPLIVQFLNLSKVTDDPNPVVYAFKE